MVTRKLYKILCGALATLLCGSMAGCVTDNGGEDNTLRIVASNFALYDFARVYECEGIEARMLIAPGSESHDLEATLADISVVSEADIFLYAGGESDLWVDTVFDSLGEAGDGIIRINALEFIEGTVHGEDHADHVHDEHVWTSIPNAIALIEEVGRAIGQIDETQPIPEDAADYLASLTALDAAYRHLTENAARREIAVADRFPFTHMAREYGITYSAAFDGCSSNVEVPLSVIGDMIAEVREKSLPAVFYIEFSDRTAVDAVCNETDTMPLLLHSCHNVTRAEFNSGITYLNLMEQNLANLKKALN